jgi:hypothetical protein
LWLRQKAAGSLLFLDTEYTDFSQSQAKLISLALVAKDGQREFYAELIG